MRKKGEFSACPAIAGSVGRPPGGAWGAWGVWVGLLIGWSNWACVSRVEGYAMCGDGVRQGDEQCDGDDIPVACHTGFGVMGCEFDCELDDSGCSAYCGDFTTNGPELCDGDDFPVDCTQGWLICASHCDRVDTSACEVGSMLVPMCAEPSGAEGLDADADGDGDGLSDAVDRCPGFDDTRDDDADGIANGCDLCPRHDDAKDRDGDGLPDACDPFPEQSDWTRTATVGGLAVFRGITRGELAVALDALERQRVSVVEADSDLSNYMTDVDFAEEMQVVRTTTEMAHARGMRVLWYYPALESVTPDGRISQISMAQDHPEWLQLSIDGAPNVFYGTEAFWVPRDGESAWLDPLTGYRQYFLSRIRELATTGVDGVWIDVPLLNDIIGYWPSHAPASRDRFLADTGYEAPRAVDESDPAWWPWISWRHEIISEFLEDIYWAARDVSPSFQVVVENVTLDHMGAMVEGLDATHWPTLDGFFPVWEVDTTSESHGMIFATADDWLSLIGMMKFGSGVEPRQPSWAFTYGNVALDAELVLAEAVAAQNNPYELKAPEMTSTVGACYRRRAFRWIERNRDLLFRSVSAARLVVLYSSATRDLVDGPCLMSESCGKGMYVSAHRPGGLPTEATWWADLPRESAVSLSYLAEHKGLVKALVHLHQPFDVRASRRIDVDDLSRYDVAILPDLQALSDDEAEHLLTYVEQGGHALLTGPAPASRRPLGETREHNPLGALLAPPGTAADACVSRAYGLGVATHCNWRVGKAYLESSAPDALLEVEQTLASAGTAPLQTDAPANIHFELYRRQNRLLLHIINFVGADGVVTVEPQSFRVSLDVSTLGPVSRVVATSMHETKVLPHATLGGAVEFDVSVGAHVAVIVLAESSAL